MSTAATKATPQMRPYRRIWAIAGRGEPSYASPSGGIKVAIDPRRVRAEFPSLSTGAVFFDNPAGTQVPRRVVDRMNDCLLRCNANLGGAFETSIEAEALVGEARAAVADLINARRADEVCFGPNMTTLTFSLSRALARRLEPGDEIVVTRLDHDANISPWLFAAADRGAVIRWVDIHEEDCTLDMDCFERALSSKTKLVACGYASNAVGTVNDVARVVLQSHAAGAMCFIDAVHYAPHGPIDVQALDCDFLVCSTYKFFGPHAGILYGKYDVLDEVCAYKVRPARNAPPGKFETGTQSHESIAGVLGAVEYLEWVGSEFGCDGAIGAPGVPDTRSRRLRDGLLEIRRYEAGLGQRLIAGLKEITGLHIYGISDPNHASGRVPTVSFTLGERHPRWICEQLAAQQIHAWDGNYYALAIMERLGLEGQGGMVRVGLAHYNVSDEVERFLGALGALA